MKQKEKPRTVGDKVRRPIGRTLMVIISLLILVSLGGVTAIVSYFVTRDILMSAKENNLTINGRTASTAEASIQTAIGAVDLFLDLTADARELEKSAEKKEIAAKETDAEDANTESTDAENHEEGEPPLLAAQRHFFERNENIFAVYESASPTLYINDTLQERHEVTKNVLEAWGVYAQPSMARARSGEYVFKNASPFFGFPLLAIIYPRAGSAVCILYDTTALSETFSAGTVNQSFLVNAAGEVLVHTDVNRMLILSDESENPVFAQMKKSGQKTAQIQYRIQKEGEVSPSLQPPTAFSATPSPKGQSPLKSPADSPASFSEKNSISERSERPTPPTWLLSWAKSAIVTITSFAQNTWRSLRARVQEKLASRGEEYIGAYSKLSFGNGGVITTVQTAVLTEGIRATTRRNIYITAAILALAVLIAYWFAKSLSEPLQKLTEVANEINRGNFNTELFGSLKTRGKNEISVLARSTQNERKILNMVSKLTNQGVTRAVITNQIDFEPHLKDITIFFSDIRGFTAISDGFKNRFGEKSAAEIIGFLNDYMSRMVACISRTGGVVDKFEGDAIMAAWGVLRNESLDWEKLPATSAERAKKQAEHDAYIREDALNAITACIAMRYSLMKYNKDAEAFTKAHESEPQAKYKPHIRIGAGLNSGRATVGFMGSYDKLEFTSIGDAVNFASRTEASNKPCGTDILITEDTLALLKDFVRSESNNFTLSPENEKNEIIVEQIPVDFEVKGKGTQHFYGVVNMPRFDIAEFFSAFEQDFALDADCARSVGAGGPKTLSEMRKLLGIAEPNFGQVDLNAEENKIQVAAQ